MLDIIDTVLCIEDINKYMENMDNINVNFFNYVLESEKQKLKKLENDLMINKNSSYV